MQRQDIINELITFGLSSPVEFWGIFSDEQIVGVYNDMLTLKAKRLQESIDAINTNLKAIESNTLLEIPVEKPIVINLDQPVHG